MDAFVCTMHHLTEGFAGHIETALLTAVGRR